MESLKIAVNCQQNKKGELFRTCQSITEQARLETGCMQSRVAQDSDDENVILLEQQWKLWADLNTYFSSDHFRALLGAMKLFGRSYEIQINGVSQEIRIDP
jgi:quinol monooxygenase YgiN